jgi:predicted metal-binding protein
MYQRTTADSTVEEPYLATDLRYPVETLDTNVEWLVPSATVRAACEANRCGHYGKNHQCPPLVGSLEYWAKRIRSFHRARLILLTVSFPEGTSQVELAATKQPLYRAILQQEQALRESAFPAAYGFVAGQCLVCTNCSANCGGACVYPEKARPSLEAIGIDVMKLLERMGRPIAFESGKVTWVGALLW